MDGVVWRDSARPVRIGLFDARLGVLLFLVLLKPGLMTLTLLLGTAVAFRVAEARGYRLGAAIRRIRALFAGRRRALHLERYRRFADLHLAVALGGGLPAEAGFEFEPGSRGTVLAACSGRDVACRDGGQARSCRRQAALGPAGRGREPGGSGLRGLAVAVVRSRPGVGAGSGMNCISAPRGCRKGRSSSRRRGLGF